MRKIERILNETSPQEFRSAEEYAAHVRKLFAEWRQDRGMAKERLETGREPACRALEIDSPKAGRAKASRPSRIRERDIPF